MQQPPKTSGMAIAGLILSVTCFTIIGIILSIVALVQINNSNGQQTGKGLAIAGIVVGVAKLVIGIPIIIANGGF